MKNRQTKIDIQNILNDISRRYPDIYRQVFQTLNQNLSNIVQNQNEISYRIINLKNQVIQNNLLLIPEMIDILRLIGFSNNENANELIYQNQPISELNNYISILNNILSQIQPPQRTKRQNTLQGQQIQKQNFPEPKLRTEKKDEPKDNIRKNNNPNLVNKINLSNKPKLITNSNLNNNQNLNKKPNLNNNNNNYNNNNTNYNYNNNNYNNNNRVIIFIYDLSEGLAKGLSTAILGKEIEGIYHTAVNVFGYEYYYSGGINKSSPKKTKFGKPIKEINFGTTNKTKSEFEKYLRSILDNFTANNYNLISHNCNHFSDTALYFLTGKHLPNVIIKQHEEILKTPLGKQIRPFLEKMSGRSGGEDIQNNLLMAIPFLIGNVINNAQLNNNNNIRKNNNKYY